MVITSACLTGPLPGAPMKIQDGQGRDRTWVPRAIQAMLACTSEDVMKPLMRSDGKGQALRQVIDKKGIEWRPNQEPNAERRP